MKRCELCKSLARIYCESDQASLCWSCDAKVHSANFLVARHSRSLLCHVCQSPTPWSACGEKLGPTVSVCERCVDGSSEDEREESQGGNDDEIGTDVEYDGDDDGEDEDELDLDAEEDGDDNQVVPWSSTPPPPAASSSSSEDFSVSDRGVSVKRKRRNVADLSSDDDVAFSSVQTNHRPPSSSEASAIQSLPSKPSETGGSMAIVEKLKRIRHRDMISGENESAPVVGMSKATRAVGLNFNSSDSS